MAQSPEYPDLKWVPPKSWTNANRTYVQLIVIHTTEGSAHGQSAEDGAAYNQRRTDGTSAHYFVDENSVVHCVRTADQAHCARAQGNRRGIQYELCTRAGSSPATWANPYHQAMLRRAAKQAARDAKKWNIPVRHLTVAQVADGAKGFCGHYDITRAFPQDNGTHTDPGANFPWSQFLDMVRAELEDEVPLTNDDADVILNRDVIPNPYSDADTNPTITVKTALKSAAFAEVKVTQLAAAVALLRTELAAVKAAVANDDLDEGALASQLAPAVAAAVLAQLPQGSDPVSQDEVTAALKTAFRDAFAS